MVVHCPIQAGEGCDSNHAAVALGQAGAFPSVAKEHVVGHFLAVVDVAPWQCFSPAAN